MKSIYLLSLFSSLVIATSLVIFSSDEEYQHNDDSINQNLHIGQSDTPPEWKKAQPTSDPEFTEFDQETASRYSNTKISSDDEEISHTYPVNNPFKNVQHNEPEVTHEKPVEHFSFTRFLEDNRPVSTASKLEKNNESSSSNKSSNSNVSKEANKDLDSRPTYSDPYQQDQIASSAFKIQCPKSLYMDGTSYEVNMLKKSGCPKPENYTGAW